MRTDTLDLKTTIATLVDSVQWAMDARIVDDPTFYQHPLLKQLVDEGAIGKFRSERKDLYQEFPDPHHRMMYAIVEKLEVERWTVAFASMGKEARKHLRERMQAQLRVKKDIETALEQRQDLLFDFAKAMVDKEESGITMALASSFAKSLYNYTGFVEDNQYFLGRVSNEISSLNLCIEQLLQAEKGLVSVSGKYQEQLGRRIVPVRFWNGDLRRDSLMAYSLVARAFARVGHVLANICEENRRIFRNDDDQYDIRTVTGWEPNNVLTHFMKQGVNVRLIYNGWRRMKEQLDGPLPENVRDDLYFDWVMERRTPYGNRDRVMPVQWELDTPADHLFVE